MAEPKKSYDKNEYNEDITTVRGSKILLVDSEDNTPENRVGLVAVKTKENNYYFVQDSISGQYCSVHCPRFIEDAEKRLRKTRAKYLRVNNPALMQELIDSEKNEDNERSTNVINLLMKMLEEKGRVGIEHIET